MSGTALALRPYQREAIDAVAACHARGVNRPAVVIATGGGKTVTLGHMAAANTAGRTLVLAHREELIDQAHAQLTAIAPQLRPGIEMASRTAGDTQAVVGSVQTMCSPRRLAAWSPDAFSLVIIDESHHAAAESYDRVMRHFGCYDGTPTVGFTATLARGDGVGLGGVWQEVAYERGILELIAGGYLVNPRGIRVPLAFDLSQARVEGGDYTAGSLGRVMDAAGLDKAIARAWQEHAGGRPGIAFTPDIATAKAAAAALRDVGASAEAVWGEMDKRARRDAVNGLRDGTLDMITNCGVLTEGTDIPRAAVAIMGRPTRSPVLFCQMAGRVLRPFPGKDGAWIIDLVGLTADHRLCTLVDLADGRLQRKSKNDPRAAEEGESLTEAYERVSGVRLGPAKEVNLFAASHSTWLQTKGGFWFIPAGAGHVALYTSPTAPGKYAVAIVPPGGAKPLYTTSPIEDITLAMAIGEEKARAFDRASGKRFSTSTRSAAWRARRPSEKMLATAGRMHLKVPEGATAGEVSDLMSIRFAGRIDRLFTRRGSA